MKQVLTRPLNGEATVRRKLIATLSYSLATREHTKSLYRTKSGKVILSETRQQVCQNPKRTVYFSFTSIYIGQWSEASIAALQNKVL